ncbi:MAG: helix-turn-helix domain-containing protein [Planctomycetia bacterium]|nr:helix-turn-helix domain-containing protein [Planctomycetia bacterium]
MKRARQITLTNAERSVLLRWSRDQRAPARLVLRARIVLLAAKGLLNQEIAAKLGTLKKTVGLWRRRFAEQRLAGIERDATRPGPRPPIPTSVIRKILRKTTTENPTAAPNWSTRTMAKAVGVSHATVQRVWSANGLKPHLLRTGKVFSDPHFVE